jgi:hypothetical protein
MKYFFLLAGFELRTFNDAVGKKEKNYWEGREKKPRKFAGKGGKIYPGNFPVR